MAAKAKAPVQSKARAVTKKTPAATAAPKGLQLTTAQQAAYNKAYAATASALRQKIALKAFAQAFRKYRLNAAFATIKKYNIARGNAQAAAVAAYAARRSWIQSRLAHQNSALQARIELDMYNHANLSGRLQYIQAGEKAYAHAAVMRTVDTAQAVAYEARLFSKIARTATKAGKSTLASGPNSAAIKRAAIAAGLAAARKVHTTPVRLRKTATASTPKTTRTGSRTTKSTKASTKASAKAHSTSRKAPAKRAKARTAANPAIATGGEWAPEPALGAALVCTPASPISDGMAHSAMAHAAAFSMMSQSSSPAKPKPAKKWVGDTVTPNCIITAVANHLLHTKSVIVTEREITELTEACGPEPTIEEVLWQTWLTGWPFRDTHLAHYEPAGDEHIEDSCLVIGYEAKTEDGWKDHAALSLADGKVVSWGSVTDRDAVVEEAWRLRWE